MDRAFRSWLPVVAVGALLFGGAATATLSAPRVTRLPQVPRKDEQPESADRTGADDTAVDLTTGDGSTGNAFELPGWFGIALSVFCLLVVAVVAGLLIWYVFRDRIRVRSVPFALDPGQTRPPAERTGDVVAALDEGLTHLSDTDRDPRRAVIACWVRLEEAAAAAGTPRRPGDTATDLVARLLAAHQVSQQVLGRFADVYREARYASHVVDEQMRAAAVASLGQLRAELTAGVRVR